MQKQFSEYIFSSFSEHWRHLNQFLYQDSSQRRGNAIFHILTVYCIPSYLTLLDVQCVKLQPWWFLFTVRPSKFLVVLRDGILFGLVIPSWWYETCFLDFVIIANCPSCYLFPIWIIPVICIIRSLISNSCCPSTLFPLTHFLEHIFYNLPVAFVEYP